MTEAIRHYERLLAKHYTWMFGVPFEAKVAEQRALLKSLGVSGGGALAVDLGCGPGFQSVALAELGFKRVLAVDTSEALLRELESRKGSWPIETRCADMRNVSDVLGNDKANVVVCMGDTLTHLPARSDVSQLCADVKRGLVPGGLFVLTFRDLSVELTGLDRFVPVHSEPDRIMTCFLEYEPETVVVHDLIHERAGEGWSLHKSSYRKLRLSPDSVADDLRAAGFGIERSEPAGRLWAIVARAR